MPQNYWQDEYTKLKNLPSSRTMKPSRTVQWFINEYSGTTIHNNRTALDLGSGEGRNSIYLAHHGYHVTGVELVTEALAVARTVAENARVADKIQFVEQSIGKTLPFRDNSFDLIIDMMALHLLDKTERTTYAQEVIRLLKPNGNYVFFTNSANSPAAQILFKSSPGLEENSYIIPQSGVFEKTFTKDELEKLFSPLRLQYFHENYQQTSAFGEIYDRAYFTGVMTK